MGHHPSNLCTHITHLRVHTHPWFTKESCSTKLVSRMLEKTFMNEVSTKKREAEGQCNKQGPHSQCLLGPLYFSRIMAGSEALGGARKESTI
jgi:hypothetical protein